MKWLLVLFAIWNVACALLRLLRMPLEKLHLSRRLYPRRDMLPLDRVSDLELSPGARARYTSAVQTLCRLTGIAAPELMCSPSRAMAAGTRGWRRHQLQVSRGVLAHAGDGDLLAILAHEFGHIYYRHFAVMRVAEIAASMAYSAAVWSIWRSHFTWYAYLGIWSLLDFSFSMFRLSMGSATELMADRFAARRLGLACELSRGLARAQCFNGATEFTQITHFYPTVRLRLWLLARYAGSAWSNLPSNSAPNAGR